MEELKPDAEFMADEDAWPRWPILPVKRSGMSSPRVTGKDTGILYSGQGPTIYLVNMFDMSKLETCDKAVFSSFEDLTSAGWVVD